MRRLEMWITGKTKRRRGLRPYTKLKDYKKVYVRTHDEEASKLLEQR